MSRRKASHPSAHQSIEFMSSVRRAARDSIPRDESNDMIHRVSDRVLDHVIEESFKSVKGPGASSQLLQRNFVSDLSIDQKLDTVDDKKGQERTAPATGKHRAIQSTYNTKTTSSPQKITQSYHHDTRQKFQPVIEELQMKSPLAVQFQNQPKRSTAEIWATPRESLHVDKATQWMGSDSAVETYFCLGLMSFICCPLFSILSLISSRKIKKDLKLEDYPSARKHSCRALCWGIFAVVIGMTLYVTAIIGRQL